MFQRSNKANVVIPGVGEEEIVLSTRRHWASLLGIILLILAMFVAPTVLVVMLYGVMSQFFTGFVLNILVLIGSVYALVLVTFIFFEWVNFYYDLFVFTEDEIIDIDQSGFFNRNINQIALTNIQDVSGQIKGIMPTLFGYGNVTAESAGDNTKKYVIENIPNPLQVADLILELHNQAVARKRRYLEEEMTEEKQLPTEPTSSKQEAHISEENKEVEINKDDLNKGGEIKIE